MCSVPDVAIELQRALIARAKAASAVTALVGTRVYDEPPQGVTYPYVRIGNLDVRPLRTTCVTSWDVLFTLEGHSRPGQGRVEANRIGSALVAAFDDHALSVTGFTLSWLWFVTMTTIRAADGRSYQCNTAFEAMLTAAP
jgi:hypothetical protein